jgi:hypothetical protein
MPNPHPDGESSKPIVQDPARARTSAIFAIPPRHETTYSFDEALGSGAFGQLDLVTHSQFASLADKRGVKHLKPEMFERLDKQGALRPIAFQTNSGAPALHSKRFSRWNRYARKVWGRQQVDALYSPWQLLYLDAAVNSRYVDVDVATFLDGSTDLTPKPRSAWRMVHRRNLHEWRRLDEAWLPVILLLVRIQNRYFPTVRGTVQMEPGGADPFRRELAAFDPKAVAAELGWTSDDIKRLYDWLSFRGTGIDPMKGWYPIFRTLSHREQEKFRGLVRQAHDYYDAAGMLRRWYRDITDELLPDCDEVGAFPPDWRPNWLGHERRMTYDRKDMQRLLEMHGAYPNRVHVLVEGETEEAVLEALILAFRDTDPAALGVKIEPFSGVGNVTGRLLKISSYAREAVLVADNEGDLARTVETLQKSGELENLHVRLCDKNFEEDNLTVDELVEVGHAAAKAHNIEIDLTADELRQRQARDRSARPRDPRGLTSILIEMLRAPDVGPVVVSKVELGKHIADFLLEKLNAAEDQAAADAIIDARPILKLAADIVRVTGR